MDKKAWMEMIAKILLIRNVITKEEYKNVSKEIRGLR